MKADHLMNIEDKEVSKKEERYYYFLAVTFICFLIEWII